MKKIVIAGSIVVFIVLVVLISSFFMDDDRLTHAGHIPDNIGAYYLTNKVEGEEAKQIMNQLHEKEVELNEAYALEYQTRQGAYAIVWISESSEDGVPLSLFENMKTIIETSDIYSSHSETMVSGKPVQYAFGMERDHYYFVNDDRFIFVATFEETRERFITNAIKIF
ncbi:hypothetical protein BKP45_15305 [Anaerobacillus alkalidiazotrophicus]|uniref:DUF4367 domain-containing protein n=1 Tax=Anaerobacillus alkalidiazotrophicus TaxID=472963 RepID=A0A1S2M376_9BACI|nr:hypothetical protein [Anaerobacillus alkalidiazotrophicus]OIJ18893.1 hypothetical protein BKP45_15305 [Anaerobacillus alkalidiazotrophicus]